MKNLAERVLPAGALLIAAAGLAIDLRFGGDAFARAGSLMVAYGVTLAGREVYLTERAIAKYEARVDKVEATILDDEKKEVTPEAFSRIAKNRSKYRSDRLDRVGRLIYAEIGIVVAGTLIWGFGDLAV